MATPREAFSSFQTEERPFRLSLLTVGGSMLFSNTIPSRVITFRDLCGELRRSSTISTKHSVGFVDMMGRLLPPEAILRQQCQDGDCLTIVFSEPNLALVRDKLPDLDSRLFGEEEMLQTESNLSQIVVALHKLFTSKPIGVTPSWCQERPDFMEILQEDVTERIFFFDPCEISTLKSGPDPTTMLISERKSKLVANVGRYVFPRKWNLKLLKNRKVLKQRQNSKRIRRRVWEQLRQRREEDKRMVELFTPLFCETGLSVKLFWEVNYHYKYFFAVTLFAALA